MKKLLLIFVGFAVAGCSGIYWDADSAKQSGRQPECILTPTVNYVQHMDPHGGPHQDMFLSQLAMNYRSFAIFNSTISCQPDIGEMFAQKAIAAFSGQAPMPQSVEFWQINDQDELFDLRNANRELIGALNNDAAEEMPRIAAEAQAKFDCWVSASASGQIGTARECRGRFEMAMIALGGNGRIVEDDWFQRHEPMDILQAGHGFEAGDNRISTAELGLLTDTRRTREGVVIVNNINVPSDLIRPAPVHPVQFTQNIYHHGPGGMVAGGDGTLGGELVSRDEFINMMMALRNEIQEINRRMGERTTSCPEATKLKVKQIPATPQQRIMEEIFEVRFDFGKAAIKPEYESIIRRLAETARANPNVKISIVGHTDTVGSADFNFALGGRRAQNVKRMLVSQGIPASSIIILSSGKNDLKVPTGPNVRNAENRRARVVKEIRYMEPTTTEYGIVPGHMELGMPEPVRQ